MLDKVGKCTEIVLRTSADILHVLSLVTLLVKMKRTRSCSGISLKAQILYLTVYIWRYTDLVYFFLYTKKMLTQYRFIYNGIMKVVFISLQSNVIYKMMRDYFYSYDSEYDDTPISYMIIFSLVSGGFLFKIPEASSNRFIRGVIEWMWASSVVLESVSILPQLTLLNKAGEGETLTIHYVLFLGLYRLIYMLIWVFKWATTRVLASHLLLWGAVLQTLIYTELFMVYIKSFVAKGRIFKVNPKRFLYDALSLKK
ncbi:ER lumen protein retaining receptor [Nematocida major]|uniref:ER lumen protein retaining receptor n=1 Tax=Nematocida major TaxID=1912982 RepID=UPI002008A549|nr:ER lumen protein retaining receptor [Nematocida major]KAH9385204.1 ER lumen protein retaining receptor [Nematocida major]